MIHSLPSVRPLTRILAPDDFAESRTMEYWVQLQFESQFKLFIVPCLTIFEFIEIELSPTVAPSRGKDDDVNHQTCKAICLYREQER